MDFNKTKRNEKPSIETSRVEFHHANNLQYGRGRLLWAGALRRDNGVELPEGWVLPGGRRTQDAEESLRAAQYIDSISR